MPDGPRAASMGSLTSSRSLSASLCRSVERVSDSLSPRCDGSVLGDGHHQLRPIRDQLADISTSSLLDGVFDGNRNSHRYNYFSGLYEREADVGSRPWLPRVSLAMAIGIGMDGLAALIADRYLMLVLTSQCCSLSGQ